MGPYTRTQICSHSAIGFFHVVLKTSNHATCSASLHLIFERAFSASVHCSFLLLSRPSTCLFRLFLSLMRVISRSATDTAADQRSCDDELLCRLQTVKVGGRGIRSCLN